MVDDSSSIQRLFFTSSTSKSLPIVHDNPYAPPIALTGLYSCTIKDYGASDDDFEDDGGYCIDPEMVADRYGAFYKDLLREFALPLMNVQFYVSSKKNKNGNGNGNGNSNDGNLDASKNDDGNNYLYGGTTNYHAEYPLYTWEILRADFPSSVNTENESQGNTTTASNSVEFQPYFRTLKETDWNNCNFDCCPYTDDVDSSGIYAHRDYHDNSFLHSYIRTAPKAFAIDHITGDVFVAWEGFYKNCNPTDFFSAAKSLEWTVGISRLKTEAEDPTCILAKAEDGEFLGYSDLENNFARPVAILFKGTSGHDVVLPHGGFSVLPAAQDPDDPQFSGEKINDNGNPPTRPRRSFLVTTLQVEKGALRSNVWVIPEGGDVTRNLFQRQHITSTAVDHVFMGMNVWNGGNQRLHYNKQTGRPDHLCHTVFDKGIDCMSISVTEDKDSVYVKVNGDPETFLTEVGKIILQARSSMVQGGWQLQQSRKSYARTYI